MARKITGKGERRKTSGKQPGPAGRKPMVVQIRGSEEWKAWIEALADKENDTVAKFFERLARRHAEAINFKPMPKR